MFVENCEKRDEMNLIKIIKEENYQKFKKEMHKKDDYFTAEELKKISVILA